MLNTLSSLTYMYTKECTLRTGFCVMELLPLNKKDESALVGGELLHDEQADDDILNVIQKKAPNNNCMRIPI